MYRIQAEGLDEVVEDFKQAGNIVIWRKMFHDSAIDAKRYAKHLCPVDTGHLRNSIYIRKMSDLAYELGFTVYYGLYNEYGWSGIPPIGDEQHPVFYKSGYRPFLRPAMWRMVHRMPDMLGQYFNILK